MSGEATQYVDLVITRLWFRSGEGVTDVCADSTCGAWAQRGCRLAWSPVHDYPVTCARVVDPHRDEALVQGDTEIAGDLTATRWGGHGMANSDDRALQQGMGLRAGGDVRIRGEFHAIAAGEVLRSCDVEH